MGTQIPVHAATGQKHAHTATKKSSNAPQQRPRPHIEAHQLGSIGVLMFVLPNIQRKQQRQRGQLSLVVGETQQRWR